MTALYVHPTHTSGVNNRVHTLHSLVEATRFHQVLHKNEFQPVIVLWTVFEHALCLLVRPCCGPNLEPATKQLIDDVCTDETSGSCDKDVLTARILDVISSIGCYKLTYEA